MIPDKCPHCGAGVMMAEGEPCRSETSAMFACYTVVASGQDDRAKQSSCCIVRETPFLRARVRELEAVVNDPEALWANWMRGTVRLPSGIGDVRQHQERIRELEEWNKRLVEAGDKLHWAWMHPFDDAEKTLGDNWNAAKEAKP